MTAFRLAPSDELPHPPDATPHYNESVYLNAFDDRTGAGGWLRLGNRPNEGRAELSICLYLPDGRLACRFSRPSIDSGERFEAGGLRYGVEEPLRRIRVAYDGPLVLLDDPDELRDPAAALARPPVHGRLELVHDSVSPPHGGEPTRDDQPTAYGRDFSLGHYNLHTRARGQLQLGDETFAVDGFGWRDHSWGPRQWSNLFAHRLVTVGFGPDRGLMLHKVEDRDGTVRRLGTVLVDGAYEEVTDLDLVVEWDERAEPVGARLGFRTDARAGVVDVRVRSLAPLRNRRRTDDAVLHTRILEAAVDVRWNERVGVGMFELVEQLDDGRPVAVPA